MKKRILIAGLLGGIAMIVWAFVVNGILGFQARMDMKKLNDEQAVYAVLKEQVPGPGRYACNPVPVEGQGFPLDEPAYSILYGGVGHEAAGNMLLLHLVLAMFLALIGAALLSRMSEPVLGSYWKRVMVFTCIGLVVALQANVWRSGIGDYPLADALLMGLNTLAMWTFVGLVVASIVKPVAGGKN